MPKFRFLPEVATGIAYEARGTTERALAENAALALFETLVDTKTVRRRTKEALNMRATSVSDLLFTLLTHLIFLKGAKQLYFRDVKLGVERQGKASWSLQGYAYGERYNPARHKLRSNIKGVSKDLFEVRKLRNNLCIQVILEV